LFSGQFCGEPAPHEQISLTVDKKSSWARAHDGHASSQLKAEAHDKQFEVPGYEYWPAGHAEQDAAPASDTVPVGHTLAEPEPSREKDPAGLTEQLADHAPE